MLADTSFLIDLMKGDAGAEEKARQSEEMGVSIMVSPPSIFELYVDVSLSKKTKEEGSKIVSIVESLPQLPFDLESAKAAGTIYAQKVKSGSRIEPTDAMLAGISKVHGEPVLTRNVKHFSGIEGISVQAY